MSSKKSEKEKIDADVLSEALLRGDAALIMLERMGIIAVTILLMNAAALLVVDQVSDTASRIQIGSQPHVFSQGTDESRATLSQSELISNLFSSGLAALGGRFRGVAARIEELSESLALDSKSSEQTRMLLDSGFSFGMIRGQHVDLTILGAMEVAENGDIANWKIPGKMVKGMGGAMDLVASAENIIVAMMHVNKAGESKILKRCTLPLTGVGCVKKVVTELAVLEITPNGFKLLERAPGVSVEHIIASTEADLIIEGEIPEMIID
jgi:hypothetical protein